MNQAEPKLGEKFNFTITTSGIANRAELVFWVGCLETSGPEAFYVYQKYNSSVPHNTTFVSDDFVVTTPSTYCWAQLHQAGTRTQLPIILQQDRFYVQ